MTNGKSTKRALLLSGLSLLLSAAMLVGSTFAWFTDSVTNSGNIIKAGNLKVSMEYADKLDGEWKDAAAPESPVFRYSHWEPGYSDVKYVKISNKGDLALQYQLKVAAQGEAGILAEVIDVYFGIVGADFTAPESFAEVQATLDKVGTLSDMMAENDGAAHGILLPAEGAADVTLPDGANAETGSVTACIVLHMQETAGNDYMGLAIGGDAGFALQLLATQYTYENDGFGSNRYDAGAVYADTYVASVQELETAIDAAEDGDIIGLMAGTYTFDTPVEVDKAVTLVGAGERETTLGGAVFSVASSQEEQAMTVTFENLAFTGASQLKVGFIDRQNSVYETLIPTRLVIRSCYADVENARAPGEDGTQKGQFIYLDSTYNTNLDLTIEDSVIRTSHSIEGEDASPILNGNGTNLVRACITGSTFGSAEKPCSRYAFKFARRQDGAQILFENNTVYGATTAENDFYMLDLWQSGANPYKDLQITMRNNRVIGTPDAGRNLMLAYIEASVNGENLQMALAGNRINDAAAGGEAVLNSAGVSIAE